MATVTSRFLSHKPNQRKHQRILTSTLNIVLHVHHETHQPSLISKHTKNIRDEIFGYISESRYYSISREVCNPVNVSMSQNYITRCKYYMKCLKQSQSKNPLVTTGTRGPGNCRHTAVPYDKVVLRRPLRSTCPVCEVFLASRPVQQHVTRSS